LRYFIYKLERINGKYLSITLQIIRVSKIVKNDLKIVKYDVNNKLKA